MSKVGKGNKAISVIMPEEIYDVLKQWADSRDWSVSQAAKNLIINALDREIGMEPAPLPPPVKK
jgi:hypothetical protein